MVLGLAFFFFGTTNSKNKSQFISSTVSQGPLLPFSVSAHSTSSCVASVERPHSNSTHRRPPRAGCSQTVACNPFGVQGPFHRGHP